MKKKSLVLNALVFICTLSLFGQDKTKALVSFAKVYGYVKYFHPSEEVAKIDWDKFSAYGAKEVLKCENEKELLRTFNQLFKPIAPAITFSSKLEVFDLKKITPENIDEYKLTYWQHLGVSTGMQYKYPNNAYNSVLVNQLMQVDDTTQIIAEPIFDAFPKFGELIEQKIGDQLYCQIPLTLYVNESNTYPASKNIKALQALVDSTIIDTTNLALRLGNVINVYNVIQHFYPYFDEVEVNWNDELETAIKRCFKDQTANEHLISLQKFMAPIRDGHLWIWQGKSPYGYYPDVHWEWIQDSLVITHVLDDNLDIKVGDVVTKINNQTAEEYFEEVNSRISYGTKSYLNYANKTRSLSAEKGTELTLEINNKEIKLLHNKKSSEYKFNRIAIQEQMYKRLKDDVMYINLGSMHADTVAKLLPELSRMKGLVCDFRGHNYRIWDFVAHYSTEEIPDGYTTKIPEIIYPDQERILTYKESHGSYEPKEPYLGNIKTVFIMDGRTKSSSESFMSALKHSKLATIVGEQTAGANGNINPFKLLGDITIWWTGMKVTNPDGSQFHCKGILPDVSVEKTIKGIREGKDEFLEKAIQVLEN